MYNAFRISFAKLWYLLTSVLILHLLICFLSLTNLSLLKNECYCFLRNLEVLTLA